MNEFLSLDFSVESFATSISQLSFTNPVLLGAVLILSLYLIRRIHIRLQLSFAKHPSLRGHSKMSRRMAKWVPMFSYSREGFVGCDQAPEEVMEKRMSGLKSLEKTLKTKQAKTLEQIQCLEESVSDVQFTKAYRIPFPFRHCVNESMRIGSMAIGTNNNAIQDLDGNWGFDLSGSYGINVFGYDFYKECMATAAEKVKDLGPVLGPYHPIIAENVKELKKISGLDEVSFHMSGTEAVMQAVRLARYHTGRTHLVRLCGAYHGWWDGVQPGVGNQRKTNDVYTLSDQSNQTLKILETRKDIACVLINPLQALNPNGDAPGDGTLLASDRTAQFNKLDYIEWLKKLRDVCTRKDIVLIFDEVFVGFRLAHGGAQEYYGIQADIVTYGKTLGGGLPIGVVTGKRHLMKRFKENQPANVSFARGTFNSHPMVMVAMNEFLTRIKQPFYQSLYLEAEQTWNERIETLNTQLEELDLPIKFENLHSIVTTLYTKPSRFNWMYQFYLEREGLVLGWIGSGRFIMSLSYTDEEFSQISEKIIRAAEKMRADQWWWQGHKMTNKQLKRLFLKDMLIAKMPFLKPLLGVSPWMQGTISNQDQIPGSSLTDAAVKSEAS